MIVLIITAVTYLIGFIISFILRWKYNKRVFKKEYKKEALYEASLFAFKWPWFFIFVFGVMWLIIFDSFKYRKQRKEALKRFNEKNG